MLDLADLICISFMLECPSLDMLGLSVFLGFLTFTFGDASISFSSLLFKNIHVSDAKVPFSLLTSIFEFAMHQAGFS